MNDDREHFCSNCFEHLTIIQKFKTEVLKSRSCHEIIVKEEESFDAGGGGDTDAPSEEYLADGIEESCSESSNEVSKVEISRAKRSFKASLRNDSGTKLAKLLAKHNVKFVENTGKPTKSPKIQCSLCDKVLTMHSFPVHLQQVHEGNRVYNFMCEFCSKKCISNAELVIHRRSHTKEKPFQCDLCKNRFNCKKNLIQHLRTIHLNQRRANKTLERCSICLKQFSHDYLVHFHMRKAHPAGIDDGIKVNEATQHYHCESCGGQYKTRRYFDNHVCISGAGDGPANQACLICKANFTNRFETMKHIQEIHAQRLDEARWKCLVCETIVLDKIVLHIESVHTTQSSKCQYCSKKLKNRRCLRNHIFVMHESGSEIRKQKRREKKKF
jgi:hypothetical protein